jgi:hypothetical protein
MKRVRIPVWSTPSILRCPQYRTLSRPIGTGLRGSFLRPNCLRPAQPRQLRRSVLDRLRDMSCICGRQRPGISTAPNPRATCWRSTCPGFCPMAIWRRIAQDRRGADHRLLDSRIKAARCGRSDRKRYQVSHEHYAGSPKVAFSAKSTISLSKRYLARVCGEPDRRRALKAGACAPPLRGCGLDRPPPPRRIGLHALKASLEPRLRNEMPPVASFRPRPFAAALKWGSKWSAAA